MPGTGYQASAAIRVRQIAAFPCPLHSLRVWPKANPNPLACLSTRPCPVPTLCQAAPFKDKRIYFVVPVGLAAQRRCSMLDALGACAALSLALWLFACLLIRPLTPFFRHPLLLHPVHPQLVTSRGCLDKRQAAEGFTNSAQLCVCLLCQPGSVLSCLLHPPPSPLCYQPFCISRRFALIPVS